jgi:hypothetical protein
MDIWALKQKARCGEQGYNAVDDEQKVECKIQKKCAAR